MTRTKAVSKAEKRKQLQRERILDASRCCFENRGFHAASMATIAETAGMSPGLIYRYFENKNAIILAIIEQQLEIARQRIRELHSSSELSARILEYFDESEAGDRQTMSTVLYLEMSAEATRDKQIADALKKYDVAVCSELAGWLSRREKDGGCGLPAALAPARALMLLSLIEGLKARGTREEPCDRKRLKHTLDDVLASLVTYRDSAA
jgi:AcrR family transcriptional regulator